MSLSGFAGRSFFIDSEGSASWVESYGVLYPHAKTTSVVCDAWGLLDAVALELDSMSDTQRALSILSSKCHLNNRQPVGY